MGCWNRARRGSPWLSRSVASPRGAPRDLRDLWFVGLGVVGLNSNMGLAEVHRHLDPAFFDRQVHDARDVDRNRGQLRYPVPAGIPGRLVVGRHDRQRDERHRVRGRPVLPGDRLRRRQRAAVGHEHVEPVVALAPARVVHEPGVLRVHARLERLGHPDADRVRRSPVQERGRVIAEMHRAGQHRHRRVLGHDDPRPPVGRRLREPGVQVAGLGEPADEQDELTAGDAAERAHLGQLPLHVAYRLVDARVEQRRGGLVADQDLGGRVLGAAPSPCRLLLQQRPVERPAERNQEIFGRLGGEFALRAFPGVHRPRDRGTLLGRAGVMMPSPNSPPSTSSRNA